MTRLWLVRHGPTHATGMVGWSDLPADLSDTDALARLNAHLPADAPVVSSDLTRAVTTADALSPRRRLPHDRDWRELNFGRWELRRWDEVEDQARARAFWDDPGDTCPPGGESWNALTARVTAAIDRLAAHPEVIVVAHFGPILAALQLAEGLTPAAAFTHRIEPLSVTCLDLGPAPRAMAINHRP
ncbi:histidine phosphatase family protein [Rhodobacter sp. Har01]|uniref:histidine phosphatase family protein n=1 Tax=Rhodobacter sp. Har01 TaxID=2883999 RepID=UPI001D08EB5F|nr:histidine phosphatase family protein [Rhodobacter sp. Har01]MCB6179005.1 histidine phosphatase family protein [Rhodobacter sp. Har01]